jgi:hypothetical protein
LKMLSQPSSSRGKYEKRLPCEVARACQHFQLADAEPTASCTNYTGGESDWKWCLNVPTCFVPIIIMTYERTAFLACMPLAKSCYHGREARGPTLFSSMWINVPKQCGESTISCPVKSCLGNGHQAELSCRGYSV